MESFVHEVQHAYELNPTMTLLKRSLNFHEWLESSFSKFHSAISLPRQFIFSKNNDVAGTHDGVQAMVRCFEWSNSMLGEPMFPLQRLPISKPKWNANRSVFSRWETSSIRTTLEKSEEIFQKAEAQFLPKRRKTTTCISISNDNRGRGYSRRFVSGKGFRPKITMVGGRYLTKT